MKSLAHKGSRWLRSMVAGFVVILVGLWGAIPAAQASTGTQVSNVSVSVSDPIIGSLSKLSAQFTNTTALSVGSDSITISVPAGLTLPYDQQDYMVTVTPNSGVPCGYMEQSTVSVSGNTVSVPLPVAVQAGSSVQLDVSNVSLPSQAQTYPQSSFAVSTTTDTQPAPASGADIVIAAPQAPIGTPDHMVMSLSSTSVQASHQVTVTGAVYQADNSPVAGATVLFRLSDGTAAMYSAVTGPDGSFQSYLNAPSFGTTVNVSASVYGTSISNSARFQVQAQNYLPGTALNNVSVLVNGQAPNVSGVQGIAAVDQASGELQMQLQYRGNYDLTGAGISNNDTVTMSVYIPSNISFHPSMAMATGSISDWSIQSQPDGSSLLTLEAKPLSTSWVQSPPGIDDSWPQLAQMDYSSMLITSFYDSSLSGGSADFNGSYVGTNAQSFSQPYLDPTTNSFTFQVAAPHATTAGVPQVGTFIAFIPNSALTNVWHISDPSTVTTGSLTADMQESGASTTTVTPEITQVAGGIKVSYTGFSYSSETISLKPTNSLGSSSGAPGNGSSGGASSGGGTGSSSGSSSGSSDNTGSTPGTTGPTAFGTVLTTKSIDSAGGTIAQSFDNSAVSVDVPKGAFTSAEQISLTTTDVSTLTTVVPQGSHAVVALGVNFTGATPSVPITVTINNKDIPANAQIFKIRDDGSLILVPSTVTAGKATITFSSDPNFVVVTPIAVTGNQKAIQFNGKSWVIPGVVHNNTTYMPIWYVMQALNQAGVSSAWDGQNWRLIDSASVDLTKVNVGSGSMHILLNGTLVQSVNGMSVMDPSTHAATTYMPVWYVMQILQRAGVQSHWDGAHWVLSK